MSKPLPTSFEQLLRRLTSRLDHLERHQHAPSQELVTRISDLETALAAATAFTPFTQYAPSLTNWTAGSSNGWQRLGRMVIWRFVFTRNVGSGDSGTGGFTLGTTPAEARPIEQGIFCLLYVSNVGAVARRLQFDSTGLLNVSSGSNVSEGNSVSGSVAFIGPE